MAGAGRRIDSRAAGDPEQRPRAGRRRRGRATRRRHRRSRLRSTVPLPRWCTACAPVRRAVGWPRRTRDRHPGERFASRDERASDRGRARAPPVGDVAGRDGRGRGYQTTPDDTAWAGKPLLNRRSVRPRTPAEGHEQSACRSSPRPPPPDDQGTRPGHRRFTKDG